MGQKLHVWTAKGPVVGVIARKPIHLLPQEERKSVPEIKDLWIDIAAASGDEAREAVAIGDPVTLELGFETLRNEIVVGPGMDNRVGVWVVMQALKRVAAAKPQAAVFGVSTVQEEIGLRGAQTSAFTIAPQIGIAVDVTHATDCPTIDENQFGRVKLGKGPVLYRGPNVNPVVFEQLSNWRSSTTSPSNPTASPSRPATTPTCCRSPAAARPPASSRSPTVTCTARSKWWRSPTSNTRRELIAHFCLSVTATSDFTP